jgi:hypothetical protein
VDALRFELGERGTSYTLDSEKMDAIQKALAQGSGKTTRLVTISEKAQSAPLESIDAGTRTATGSIVNTHKTFDDWLGTFTENVSVSKESEDDEDLAEFQKRRKNTTNATLSSVPEQHAEPHTELSSGSSPESLNPNSADGSVLLSNGKVKLVFRDLEKEGESTRFTEVFEVSQTQSLYAIILQLIKKGENQSQCKVSNAHVLYVGYHRICGFRDEQNEQLVSPPMVPFNAPFPVTVTKGESCYDIRVGLKMNQHERLIDYYNGFLSNIRHGELLSAPMVTKEDDSIAVTDHIRQSWIDIHLKRALRIPEDGKTYPLPAFFDSFRPLNVGEFSHELPKQMAKKGGVFIPLFQREALALCFEGGEVTKGDLKSGSYNSRRPSTPIFAVKVYAGSVNCVTGRAASDTESDNEQDYIVCPQQVRLDGFRTRTGEVKQFVAMPLGWNYTVEKPVTGSEYIGGLQLQIAPRLSNNVEFYGSTQERKKGATLDLFLTPADLGIHESHKLLMRDLSSAARQVDFDMSAGNQTANINPRLYPLSKKCRPLLVSDIFGQCSAGQSSRRFELRPVQPMKLSIEWSVLKITDQKAAEEYSPFLDIWELREQLFSLIKHPQTKASWVLLVWKRPHGFLYEKDPVDYLPIKDRVSDDGPISFHPKRIDDPYVTSRGFGLAGLRRAKAASSPTRETDRNAGWEIGLGAGGRLNQWIRESADDRLWDWKISCFFNIQILNAVAFKSVTGISPWTPISFKHYTDYSIPFHCFLDPEESGNMQGHERELLSVGQIDMQLHGNIAPCFRMKQTGVMGCANCELNLCDKM